MKKIASFTFFDESTILVHQLEILLNIVDEVIIQSDNSTDETKEIALSYVDNKNVFYLDNKKENNFYQRDEYGDRQKLLDFVKSRNGNVHYHTDVDEILAIKDISKVKDILENCKENEIYNFRRYDFWGNSNLFRLQSNTSEHSNKLVENIKPHCVYPYIYNMKYAESFANMPVPNFHSPRIPNFSNSMNQILIEDVSMFHFGYYLNSIIEKKGNFYKTNLNITSNCWGENMCVTTEEYIEKWGMGIITRK